MSQRTRIRRHPDRAVPDEVAAIVHAGMVAHVGYAIDGQPYVIPFSYHVDADDPSTLYLHGSTASQTLRHLANGAPVCITVTHLDGIVYSKTAQSHSLNYRSIVGFGTATVITEQQEIVSIFERMTQRYIPGRTAGRDYSPPPAEDLRGMTLLRVTIDEWSAKARRGGPLGEFDTDDSVPGTAGVIVSILTSPEGPMLHK